MAEKRYKYVGDIIKELVNHSDWSIEDVMEFINSIEDADVAPRAEVLRLQSQVNRLKRYDEERDIALHERLISETKSETAMEIFAEIEEYFGMYNVPIFLTRDNFAKLKEKYGVIDNG